MSKRKTQSDERRRRRMNKVFRNGEKRAKGLKNYRYFWNSLITIIAFEIWEARFFFNSKNLNQKRKEIKIFILFKNYKEEVVVVPHRASSVIDEEIIQLAILQENVERYKCGTEAIGHFHQFRADDGE
jgi:hypothetical protein